MFNLITDTDSYKFSHYRQMPPGTEFQFSYIEARGVSYPYVVPGFPLDYTTFFGLQMYLKEYLTKPITQEMIEEASEFCAGHGEPFNREGWEYILKEHSGYLPIEIRAVPEGTNVPVLNCLVTAVNTDPKCFWLTSFIETSLLRAVWFPTTVCTISNYVKSIILKYLEETCDDPQGQINFKLHDFAGRGVSSNESAALGGAAHLVNFMGTDTVVGVLAARKYYGIKMAGFSIPAMEHSCVCPWGKENEVEAYRNMLRQFAKPGALLACVSDSYDIYNACTELWGKQLKDEVLKSGATVVVRPDSGRTDEVVLEVVRRLDAAFGSTVNKKGYKVLHPSVRVIQGDGVNPSSIKDIMEALKQAGYSTENVALGMGGALLQKLDRDTFKWAMKCSAVCVNGEWRDVFKDPVTDKGKVSKKGRLTLVKNLDTGEYRTVNAPLAHGHRSAAEQLVTVFRDGVLLQEQTFEEIRARSNEK
jgi:nicotinamide phosphoribosyltransferase